MREEYTLPLIGQRAKMRPRGPAELVLGFSFSLKHLFIRQNLKAKKLKTNSPRRPKRETRPWPPPQLRTPRRLDSKTTESRKNTNNIPLMPVNATSITTAESGAHGAVPQRIECCYICLLYTSPSPRDLSTSRMPSSA